MRRSIFLMLIIVAGLPSFGHASCNFADGTAAPKPGPSQEAMNSRAWGPTLVKLFNALSKGDKSILAAVLNKPGAATLTTECSNNDFFWTHLSLVGMSELAPDAVPAGLPIQARAFKLTEQGAQVLPGLLRAEQFQW